MYSTANRTYWDWVTKCWTYAAPKVVLDTFEIYVFQCSMALVGCTHVNNGYIDISALTTREYQCLFLFGVVPCSCWVGALMQCSSNIRLLSHLPLYLSTYLDLLFRCSCDRGYNNRVLGYWGHERTWIELIDKVLTVTYPKFERRPKVFSETKVKPLKCNLNI